MNRAPSIHTPRLVLRELVADDADDLLRTHQPAESMKWLGMKPLQTREESATRIGYARQWAEAPVPAFTWGIELRERPGVVGVFELRSWDREACSAVVGYELAWSCWGHGYMTEALAAVLDWAFEHWQLNRVTAWVHPDNLASIRLLRRLDFRAEGLMRQAMRWPDGFHDACMFGLLAGERAAKASRGAARVPRMNTMDLANAEAAPAAQAHARA